MLRLQLQGRPELHLLGYLRQSCHSRHENWGSWEAGCCWVLNLSSCSFFHASWFTRSSCLPVPSVSHSSFAHPWCHGMMDISSKLHLPATWSFGLWTISQGCDVMMEVVENNPTVHMILETTAAISLHVCLFLFYLHPFHSIQWSRKGSETVPCRSPSFCWILLQARVQFTCRELKLKLWQPRVYSPPGRHQIEFLTSNVNLILIPTW